MTEEPISLAIATDEFVADAKAREELMHAFDRNDEDGILRLLAADPSLIEAHDWALHAAACKSMQRLATWLLDHGYDVNRSRDDAGRRSISRWDARPIFRLSAP